MFLDVLHDFRASRDILVGAKNWDLRLAELDVVQHVRKNLLHLLRLVCLVADVDRFRLFLRLFLLNLDTRHILLVELGRSCSSRRVRVLESQLFLLIQVFDSPALVEVGAAVLSDRVGLAVVGLDAVVEIVLAVLDAGGVLVSPSAERVDYELADVGCDLAVVA